MADRTFRVSDSVRWFSSFIDATTSLVSSGQNGKGDRCDRLYKMNSLVIARELTLNVRRGVIIRCIFLDIEDGFGSGSSDRGRDVHRVERCRLDAK